MTSSVITESPAQFRWTDANAVRSLELPFKLAMMMFFFHYRCVDDEDVDELMMVVALFHRFSFDYILRPVTKMVFCDKFFYIVFGCVCN